MSKSSSVTCPVCGKKTRWKDEPTGTFCSNRCKSIDLGHWLNGEYYIGERSVMTHRDAMNEQDEEK